MATNTPVEASEAPKIQPQAGALKGLTTKIVTALATIGLAASVTENAEGATIVVGSMSSSTAVTDYTKPTDHQESQTSLTFTVGSAGTIATALRYQIDGQAFGTALGQTIDLAYILQRDFTGLAPATLVDTTSIPSLVRGAGGDAGTNFDRSSIISDSFFVSQPGTYTLTYTQKLDSLYGKGVGTLGNESYSTLFDPIQVNFTPVPESSVAGMIGATGALALLRRKRKAGDQK